MQRVKAFKPNGQQKKKNGHAVARRDANGHDLHKHPGRPCLYKKEYARIARAMCTLGATDAELATEFETNSQTICYWRSRFKEFSDACRLGKDVADERVERAFYNIAVGYTYVEQKLDKDGNKVSVETHRPPDAGAASKWLSLRKPDEWRESKEVDVTVKVKELRTEEDFRQELLKRQVPITLDVTDYREMEKADKAEKQAALIKRREGVVFED